MAVETMDFVPKAFTSRLRLFNSPARTVEPLAPLRLDAMRVYSCGPTVYSYQHIRNMRAYVFTDTLSHVLSYNDFVVARISNITDVGHLTSDADTGKDKLEKAASRERRSAAIGCPPADGRNA